MNRQSAITPLSALLALAIGPLAGCLERTIRVTSDPPGAMVWLNDVEIGQTPAEARFKFYGVYDVRLELDGYEPIHEGREAKAPFYEYPGPDLIASAVPARIHSQIEWHYDLKQSVPLPDAGGGAAMIERGRALRDRLGPAPEPPAADAPPTETPSETAGADTPTPPPEPRPEPPVIEPAGPGL